MSVVDDDEILYRRVPFSSGNSPYYRCQPDGTIRLSSTAFNDRNFRISVDRARLNRDDPKMTQTTPDDGVVSLLAQVIRVNSLPGFDEHGKPKEPYLLDIIPAPLPDKPAHAEIVAYPEIRGNVFDRLKKMLTQLITWEIYPADCRESHEGLHLGE